MSTVPSLVPLLRGCSIIPVLTLESAAQGVAVARALAAGGVTVAEVTLRTPKALEAIAAIRSECPEVLTGAGTILDPHQLDAALKAGAQFIVTPGTTEVMASALSRTGVPCLPGAATISEMLALSERGFSELKFFPAAAAGGLDYLKSVAGPCPHLKFCPTGGIGPVNAAAYRALANVFAVGGSWLTPKAAVDAGDWRELTRLATEATA